MLLVPIRRFYAGSHVPMRDLQSRRPPANRRRLTAEFTTEMPVPIGFAASAAGKCEVRPAGQLAVRLLAVVDHQL